MTDTLNPTSPLGYRWFRECYQSILQPYSPYKGGFTLPLPPAREDPPMTTEQHEKSCLRVSCKPLERS